MSTTPIEVDVVVIGAGPVGENVGQYAHEGGLSVALIDGELFGGECSYYACMPSKALLRPVAVADTTAHLPGIGAATVDRDALLARRDDWVSHYDDTSQVDWARGAGLDVVRGAARLSGERTVQVDGVGTYAARRAVVVATGSEAVIPEAFADLHPWTSRDATGVQEVPERLVVVGGGVVACEAATWMTALGAQVTMLVRGDRLLPNHESFAGEIVADTLRDAGVAIELGTAVESAAREKPEDTGLGRVHGGPVTIDAPGRTVVADEVLVATGRRPRLDGIGLDVVGVTREDVARRALPDWLHVIGDAGPGAPLTHMGKYEARVLGARLAGQHEHVPAEPVPVPQVVVTLPQVASVGLTEQAARDAGHDVVTAEVPWSAAAGAALQQDGAAGRAKLVVDAGSGALLGATLVGPDAADLLHAATVAIVGAVPVRVLRHAVPSYPTASELWLRLLEELPRHLR